MFLCTLHTDLCLYNVHYTQICVYIVYITHRPVCILHALHIYYLCTLHRHLLLVKQNSCGLYIRGQNNPDKRDPSRFPRDLIPLMFMGRVLCFIITTMDKTSDKTSLYRVLLFFSFYREYPRMEGEIFRIIIVYLYF